jgi:hypothetical protein
MINTPVIFTPDHQLLESKEVLDSGEVIHAVICDDVTCFKKLAPEVIHHYELIHEQGCFFSIHFDFTKDTGTFGQDIIDLKETIMHCFFHPMYKVIHNKPLICLHSNEAKKTGAQKAIPELEKYAISQGYDGIEVIYFSHENIVRETNINFSSSSSLDTISSEYARLISEKYYSSKYIGINYKDAQKTILKLTEVENKLLKDNPDHYNQLKEYQELKCQLSVLNEKITLTEKELSDQKEYLKIFRDLDESTKIMDFYKYEYEILPLWYKKMGHILKVLMGKRTFRSLFDNDVKKYKD